MLGAAVGWPFGLAVPLGVVAAANGAVSGWRRVYDWESSKGLAAVVLDSTWALPMTAAALFANAVGVVTQGGYVDDLSRRSEPPRVPAWVHAAQGVRHHPRQRDQRSRPTRRSRVDGG